MSLKNGDEVYNDNIQNDDNDWNDKYQGCPEYAEYDKEWN